MARDSGSGSPCWFPHQPRYVAAAPQNTPNVDVVIAFDVEGQVRIALEHPGAQARQLQLIGMAKRADPGCSEIRA